MPLSIPKTTRPQKYHTAKFIALSALLLTTQSSFAQQGLDFGLRANIQTSSLLNSSDQAAGNELNYKNNTSVAFGAGAGYTCSKHIGFGLDILYSKQGQGYTGTVADISPTPVPDLSVTFKNLAAANNIPFTGNYTAERDVTYLKIPLMLRYTGNSTKKVYFSSFIGPQISLLEAATYKINGQTINGDAKKTFKNVDLDAVLGIGAAMHLTDNLILSLHLRLDYGLGDAEDKSSNFYPSGRATTQNATGGGFISLSYKLVKKAKPAQKPAAKPGAKK